MAYRYNYTVAYGAFDFDATGTLHIEDRSVVSEYQLTEQGAHSLLFDEIANEEGLSEAQMEPLPYAFIYRGQEIVSQRH